MLSNNEIGVIISCGLIGGIIIILTTYLSVRYGSISGLITTIPSNTLISILGISINNSDSVGLQKSIYMCFFNILRLFIYLFILDTFS